MLFFLVDLLEREDIPYFLFWGTWLGAVRHDGMIPWDYDIDLGMPARFRDRVLGLRGAVERQGYRFFHKGLTRESCLSICYSRLNFLHVDIDFWEPDEGEGRWRNREWRDMSVANDELFPLRRCRFYGRDLWGPGSLSALFAKYGPDCLERVDRSYWSQGQQLSRPDGASGPFVAAPIDLDCRFAPQRLGVLRRLRHEALCLENRYRHQKHFLEAAKQRVLAYRWRIPRYKWMLFNGLLWLPRRALPRALRHGLWRVGARMVPGLEPRTADVDDPRATGHE
jgi:hypothetical protein